MGAERAHVELKGVHRADGEKLARHVERDLEALSAVHWAQVNAVLGSLVVAFDPEDLEVDDIVDLVEGLECPRARRGTLPSGPG